MLSILYEHWSHLLYCIIMFLFYIYLKKIVATGSEWFAFCIEWKFVINCLRGCFKM